MRIAVVSVLALLQTLLWVTPAFALGVSPASIQYDNLLEHNSVRAKLHVSRAKSTTEEVLSFRVTGSAEPYITVPQDTVTFSVGEVRKVVPVIIEPKGAPIGSYNGSVVVEAIPVDKIDAMLSFIPAIGVDISFSVTDREEEAFSVRNAYFPSQQEDSPPTLQLLIDNAGNLDWHPDVVTAVFTPEFVATDIDSGVLTQRISFDDIPVVPAKTAQQVQIVFPEPLASGRYSASIMFEQDGEIVGEREGITYYVESEESAASARAGMLPPVTSLLIGLLAFITIILIVLVVIYYLLPFLKK